MDGYGRETEGSVSIERSETAGRTAESGIRVLHLDDEPSFLETAKHLLEHHGDIVVETETDPEAALDRLDSADCVVSDYDMPGTDGIGFLESVRIRKPDLPFLLFTGKGSEEIAGEAIGAGVTDYLQKGSDADRFAVLANRITNAVERHRAEKRATAADHRVRRIYERIDDAFIAIDDEWRFTYVNQRAGELLDSDPQELVGTKVREAFPEVVGSRFDEEYRRAVKQQETVTFEEYYDPLDAWFEVRAFPDESGLSVYFRDITDRKEREAELREERAITESIFSALPDIFYVFDESGQFIRWNEQFSTVTGYSDEEIRMMHPVEFVPESDHQKIRDGIAAVFENERTVTIESAILTKDGERIPYEFTGAQLTDDDGQTLGLVGIGRDVSEHKERERRLERKNEQLEEFASLISHDLKTPLSVASGNLQLARQTGDERYLEEIDTALDRLEALIDDVLELAKQGEVVDDPEPVRLAPMLSNIETATGTEIETAYPDGAAVMAENSRLYSLLSNLVANAVEHGSTNAPQARGEEDEYGNEDVTVEVGIEDETLYVADDGPGIPESERDTVFEPGYSGDEGSGFGLAIVEAIADAHGWDISVTDSEAGGARVEISGISVRFSE